MPGFNYGGSGGFGDGTSWSKERGEGPTPGGGDNGHSGDHSGANNKGGDSANKAAALEQFSKLSGVKPSEVSNFRSDGEGGWSGDIAGVGAVHAFADQMGGYTSPTPNGGSGNSSGNHSSDSSSGNNASHVPTTWDRTANYYSVSDKVSRKALKNMYEKAISTGSIPKEARGNLRQKVQAMLDEDKRLAAIAAENKRNEADALRQASEIISDVGEKVSKTLGDKYNKISKDIAGNIKNFQGKNIRNFRDAMKSLNKLISNPNMKINQADKNALINAWKHVNAKDMANKLGNLSKGFKVADTVMKIEKVREKSIVGYETGDWGPLVLEVESWVLSGLTAAMALGIFSATLGAYALSLGVPAIAVGIAGILLAAAIGSLIDDKFANALNNEVIRPAH